jgi:hypothetical protein
LKSAIEFLGRHPFATGLMALIGLIGFAVSVVGFGLDRTDAKASSSAAQQILEKVNSISPSRQDRESVNRFIQNQLGKGVTRKTVEAKFGEPDYARPYSNTTLNVYRFDDFLVRLAFDENSLVSNYCVTTISSSARYQINNFVLGDDAFSKLPLTELPLVAYMDRTNTRGLYRYEESGRYPAVDSSQVFPCCYSFHGVRTLIPLDTLYSDYYVRSWKGGRFEPITDDGRHFAVDVHDPLSDTEYFIRATSASRQSIYAEISFQPEQFERVFYDFRERIKPDTYCESDLRGFRDANEDLLRLELLYADSMKAQ